MKSSASPEMPQPHVHLFLGWHCASVSLPSGITVQRSASTRRVAVIKLRRAWRRFTKVSK